MTVTSVKKLSLDESRRLDDFAEKVRSLNGRIEIVDADCNRLIDSGESGLNIDADILGDIVKKVCQDSESTVQHFGENEEVFAGCLKGVDGVSAVVLVKKSSELSLGAERISELCSEHSLDREQVEAIVRACSGERNSFEQMLKLFIEDYHSWQKGRRQIEKISSELSLTYEELMLLYGMSTHMKVTQTNANYLQMACDQVTQLVDVEGIAIFLEKKIDGIERLMLTAGSGLVAIDQVMVDILQNNLIHELNNGAEALLDSDVDSDFKYEWPRSIRNILAVPLQGNDKMIGLLVATNILNKPDFDSIEVKLFNCVANQCAVFIENGRLFGDLKELFMGSLKALTNSIDAKDRYTRGHSERVAFISRWIAEQLAEKIPISEEQIHHIYLAGLLHDIGKIGVTEGVLCKKGKLTDEERARIQAHPRVGASILADIKQMADIVPGVLYHHERIDGKGYPDGLTGKKIPLIGRIISLADSFDAMTSKRIYRDAMSIKRAVAEIEKGLGTQFDEEIGRVFIESDLRKLWNIIQDGFIESWDYSNFSEYGTVAVGTLIR